IKIALSLDLPSLLINPPGILPTEYNFSSKSHDKGKKSMPNLGELDATAVTKTIESSISTKHEPFACFATLPMVTFSSLPWRLYVYSLIIFPPKQLKSG